MKKVRKRVLLSWSSGKDSAWALHALRQRSDVEVAGLLTTINEQFDRIAMHAVRTALLRRQAESIGLPLRLVSLPFLCGNEVYEERLRAAIGAAQSEGIEGIAFGDLFLTDVRQYREALRTLHRHSQPSSASRRALSEIHNISNNPNAACNGYSIPPHAKRRNGLQQ